MKQQISQLTENERRWIADQLEGAATFVAAFCDGDESFSLSNLDRAFAAFLAINETDNKVVKGAINCIGITFGQLLVDRGALNWVIVADEHGTDLAVHGLPGKGDFLVFPANFVAKRWERRETNFLEALFPQMVEQIENVKAGRYPEPPPKPWGKFW